MRRRLPLVLLPLVAALALAGCGGGGGDAPATTTMGSSVEAPRPGARTVGSLRVAPVPGARSATVYDTPDNHQLKYTTADPKVSAMLSVAARSKAPTPAQIARMLTQRSPRTTVTSTTLAGQPASRIVYRPRGSMPAAVVIMGPLDDAMVTVLANAPVASIGRAEALADAIAAALRTR